MKRQLLQWPADDTRDQLLTQMRRQLRESPRAQVWVGTGLPVQAEVRDAVAAPILSPSLMLSRALYLPYRKQQQ